jgi:hypothetical protein
MSWKVFFAAVAGRYHLDQDLPCQDAGHHAVEGEVLVGAVCDGAGSASEGEFGARYFSRRVTERLREAVRGGQLDVAAETAMHDLLVDVVDEVRGEVEAIGQEWGVGLREFACTLVGCVASRRTGGCFFHVGDGFAVQRDGAAAAVLSLPENGEYSDETYFVTDEAWAGHLRLTPLPPLSGGGLIGLMSDGTAPFAIDRGRTGFFGPFIDPVLSFLRQAQEREGSEALLHTLSSEKTKEITPDDKALLLALAL